MISKIFIFISNTPHLIKNKNIAKICKNDYNEEGRVSNLSFLNHSGEWVDSATIERLPAECIFEVSE